MADNRTEYAEFLQRILNGDTSFSLLKQSIPAEKRGFFNMLFMTAMRRLTFIKETVLPRFIKKKSAAEAADFRMYFIFGND